MQASEETFSSCGSADYAPRGRGPFNVPWGARDAFILTGLAVAGVLVSLIAFDGILAAAGVNPGDQSASPVSEFGANIVFYGAILVVTLIYFWRKHYGIDFGLMGFRRIAFGMPMLRAALWTVGVLFADFLGTALWVTIVPSPALPVQANYGATVTGFILAYAGIAILAPVVEEMFFRGVLFQGFSRSYGLIAGGALSAAFFMFAHVDWHVYGRIFWTGILFAFLFYKTRSLWPSIVCHFIVNSLAVIAFFASPGP